jgi:hypothetical protein
MVARPGTVGLSDPSRSPATRRGGLIETVAQRAQIVELRRASLQVNQAGGRGAADASAPRCVTGIAGHAAMHLQCEWEVWAAVSPAKFRRSMSHERRSVKQIQPGSRA